MPPRFAADVQQLTKTYIVPEREAGLLGDLPVSDLTVEAPPIEDIIEQVFAGAREGERRRAEG